jgi:hypothetical protein
MSEDRKGLEAASTATLKRPPHPLIGVTLEGKYRIDEHLGRGGMGDVYRAQQLNVERPVAIKFLSSQHTNSSEAMQRFQREVLSIARISHSNVVAVFDASVHEGTPFFVMELIEGQSLRELHRTTQVGLPQVLSIAAQVCDALEAAHAKGIIHRDVKLSNVMLASPGFTHAKLVDFGIARIEGSDALTQTDQVIGSANAIAPELIGDARSASPRSDLYSVGALLFELIEGHPPFDSTDLSVVLRRQLSGPAPAVKRDVSPGLKALVARLLERDPSLRPSSAAVTAIRLRELASEPAPSLAARKEQWKTVALGVLAAVLLGVLLQRVAAPLADGMTKSADVRARPGTMTLESVSLEKEPVVFEDAGAGVDSEEKMLESSGAGGRDGGPLLAVPPVVPADGGVRATASTTDRATPVRVKRSVSTRQRMDGGGYIED